MATRSSQRFPIIDSYGKAGLGGGGATMQLCPCIHAWADVLTFGEKKLLLRSANGHNWMQKISRAIRSQQFQKISTVGK